jgi:hypothetical protein
MSTLDTLLSKPAQEWSEHEILQLIESLREQRERWNQEQSAGTKTRMPASKIPVKPAAKDLAFDGLKL